jgi:hypothetical protein
MEWSAIATGPAGYAPAADVHGRLMQRLTFTMQYRQTVITVSRLGAWLN